MKVGIDHNSNSMLASQHIRDCCTEIAYTTASDYKDFFESLKNVPEPMAAMSIFHKHLQKRFIRNVQNWNDLRIAIIQNQMEMLPLFRYEAPVSAIQKTNDSVKGKFSFTDSFSSVFNYMAGTVQNIHGGEDETDAADAILHKGVAVKDGKLHANHPQHADGRV